MTEKEWRECIDPDRMLELLYTSASSERKIRLFAVACCRRIWHLFTDNRSRRGVEMAEQDADRPVTGQEWQGILQGANEVVRELSRGPSSALRPAAIIASAAVGAMGGDSVFAAARHVAESIADQAGARHESAWTTAFQAERLVQCDFIRDLFGSSFYPVAIDPSWLSCNDGAVPETAESIYRERQLDDLAHLANALTMAGCEDELILSHCRQAGPHIRGCWVLDALLRKEPPLQTGLTSQEDWLKCSDPTPLLAFLKGRGSDRKWRLLAIACCRRIWPLITDIRSRTAVEVAEGFANGHSLLRELIDARADADTVVEGADRADWDAEAEASFEYTAKSCRVTATMYAAGAARGSVFLNANEPEAERACSWSLACSAIGRAAQSEALSLIGDRTIDAAIRSLTTANNAEVAEAAHQADIIRDIFGHLLGMVTNQSAWLPFAGRSVTGSPNPTSDPARWCLVPAPRNCSISPSWMLWNNGAVAKMAQGIYEENAFDRLPILADALEEAGCNNQDLLTHCREPGIHVRGCWVVDLLRCEM